MNEEGGCRMDEGRIKEGIRRGISRMRPVKYT